MRSAFSLHTRLVREVMLRETSPRSLHIAGGDWNFTTPTGGVTMAWEDGEMRHTTPQSVARRDSQLVAGMLEVFQPDPTYFESRRVQGAQRWFESGLDRFYIAAPEVLLPQLVAECASVKSTEVTRGSLSDHAPVRMRLSIHVASTGGPLATSKTGGAERIQSCPAVHHAGTGHRCAGAAPSPLAARSRIGATRCGSSTSRAPDLSSAVLDGLCP